jgi:cyanophycin synthetase
MFRTNAAGYQCAVLIDSVRSFRGPNLYAGRPVMVMTVLLTPEELVPSDVIPGFGNRLTAALPGLSSHRCSPGQPGGFLSRLRDGTFPPHVVEHVALELLTRSGLPVGFGRTRRTDQEGRFTVAVELVEPEPTELALRHAVALVDAAQLGERLATAEQLSEISASVERTRLGPSTSAIVAAARRRRIPVLRLDEANLIRLGWGAGSHVIQATIADTTSHLGVLAASDKQRTRELLREVGVPTPAGVAPSTLEDAIHFARRAGGPVVVKPRFGSKGRGVTLGCVTDHDVEAAYEVAARFGRVVVERQVPGEVHRVLVIGGAVVAASARRPPEVVGDGCRSIRELIRTINADPRRGRGHARALTAIAIDDALLSHLHASGRGIDDVPQPDEVVVLRDTANLSTGGTARDVTEELAPAVTAMCARAARVIGLDICGLDVVIPDRRSPEADGVVVLEANAAPGFRMHVDPERGAGRPVGEAVIDLLFPDRATGRVPVVAVTGTNGKTTVVRMIERGLEGDGLVVGTTTTAGVTVGGHTVLTGDCSGPRSARVVLADPTVDAAVLETARGGVARDGLGFDRCDVAVVTNVTHDHLGQDGATSLDDLVRLKAVVAGAVRPGGTIVANADDAGTRAVVRRARRRARRSAVVWFSRSPLRPAIARHVRAGGRAYVVEAGDVLRYEGESRRRVVALVDIPATMGGVASANVDNVLAAFAALDALGIDESVAVGALAGFGGEANPGRMECFRVGGGSIIVDYGHNPGAFSALGDVARAFPGRRSAVVTVPGNRDDRLLREAGEVIGREFDRVFVYEGDGRRYGRRVGEAAAIVACAAGVAAGPDAGGILLAVEDAARRAVLDLAPGDLVVVCVENTKRIADVLSDAGAERVALDALLTAVAVSNEREDVRG